MFAVGGFARMEGLCLLNVRTLGTYWGRACLLAEEKLFPLERKWGSRTAPGHSQEFS